MELLEKKLRAEGKVSEGNVLRVDHFLNQQMDIELLTALGDEFYRLFGEGSVTKILTVEASGIAIAAITAARFGVPLLFAKKARECSGAAPHLLTATVDTATLAQRFDIVLPRNLLTAEDRVLIIDDFLAKGSTLDALLSMVRASGADIVGCGIAVEKAFCGGGERVRASGVRLESLACIASISEEHGIVFVH